MKRILVILALMLPATSAYSQSFSAGVFLGTPMSGITVTQANLRLSLGLDNLGVAIDGLWSLSEWLARPELQGVYGYTGIQWVNDDVHEWGPKAGLGISVPVGHGNAELYGEAGSTWYWKEDAGFELEGLIGLRMHF
ncbi:hypothetical protein LRP49_00850 [Enterovibrio sp. ZSDZ35]|uniref:Outer membrane protein beta-barrel domain-containing protein n=1 Tax=Enterovibrio qingdaonensis TaxID=2899818 RepID=A0ABT5QGW0_9GAMM|nr:hypothetical protein [Enterovibrio sp. ZSDZ35]MDD1779730.1 hypothetical protein [Enterovibrio sp. ZSDZ35]